ncbi:unnamed protein product [Phaedon cochleariae]|uniref:Cathepsin L n=1 Tax=Phaedon cochleariae TaxID=80249 RepID=A0A9N9SIN2_PHACE|nr:unnamed protein product [Phaedon cochleariae]
MRCLLFNVLLLSFLLYEVSCSMKGEWREFKLRYKKSYESKKEERLRFKVFKENMKAIRKHNKRFNRKAELFEKGMNGFGDLTPGEFEQRYGLFSQPHEQNFDQPNPYGRNVSTPGVVSGVPDQVDWRDKGAVTPVKDQGPCGSCWIFSAVQVLESYHFLKTGELVSLSEQNVVDCFSDDTCDGGNPQDAFNFVREHGINRESDYPYQQKWGQCHPYENKTLNITFDSLKYIESSVDPEKQMKVAVAKHGPMSICMYVTAKWQFYKSGVWYHKKCSERTNHSMMLVGYGTENGQDYWLIKNSWGTHWGLDGYIKVIRNKHPNYCGMTSESVFLI